LSIFCTLTPFCGLSCDPSVWQKKWGINVQAFGSGENAIKYLGRYIMRSVIGDSRILAITDTHVTFRYIDRSDRANPRERIMTLSGIEFVRRYLRHVQPAKLRAVRYYGYHHPAARAKRQRVQQGSGQGKASNDEGLNPNDEIKNQELETKNGLPKCTCCQQPMPRVMRIFPGWKRRIETQPPQSRAPPIMEKGGLLS
jgi:Putative transposase